MKHFRWPLYLNLQDVLGRRIAMRAAAAAERHRLARAIYATSLAARLPGFVLDDFLPSRQKPPRGSPTPEGYLADGLRRSELASQAVSRSRGRGGPCALAVRSVLLPSGCTGANFACLAKIPVSRMPSTAHAHPSR